MEQQSSSAEVTEGDEPFAPHSPWSQPPIHRPSPRADPEPSKWTRRDVGSQRSQPDPVLYPPPVAPPAPPPRPPPAEPPAAEGDLYQPVNGGHVYSGVYSGGVYGDRDVDEPTIDDDPIVVPGPIAAPGPVARHAALEAPIHPYPDLELPLAYPTPTGDEFATRRAVRPREWVATTGVRGVARRGTFGLVRLRPNRREQEGRAHLSAIRRAFGGLRQITVVNPKGGAGKTVATLMLGLTFGQTRGGFVLAWDNNETQGTLGMRAQPDVHGRTVRDLLHDLDRFGGGSGRIGELAAYVRAQEEAAFDVLASDEAATAGEMLTANAFREIRDVVGRFYKLILVDTGNNVRAENWQAAVDATDQLVITMSARNDSAETAARLLDHLEQTGRKELVRRAITVVTMPLHRKDVNPRAIERHFDQRCRQVIRVPYDRHLDSGAPVRFAALSPESRRAWLRVAAAVADGL
jgi:MinD-like ATPase involved in chromosome partitioning or flagellar assembly